MQLFLRLVDSRTIVVEADENDSVYDFKQKISEKCENVPLNQFRLLYEGRHLSEGRTLIDNGITKDSTIHIAFRLLGGKGGFGAMLRSLAKKSGGKKTTDFGACRDLSGRRLRHVNDEILLNKWKEAKDRGEDFDVEAPTESGVELWFLGTPSWIEGLKSGRREFRKRFMKPRRKTQICIDWLRARQKGEPPAGAALDWGCPRGARCEFAHGEDDLRGEALEQVQKERGKAKDDEQNEKLDAWLKPIVSREQEGEAGGIAAAVAAGIAAAKKKRKLEGGVGVTKAKAKSATVRPDEAVPEKNIDSKILSEKSTQRDELDETDDLPTCLPLDVLSGYVVCSDVGEARCLGGFGTVVCESASLVIGRQSSGLNERRFFYEVEVVTGGLVQIGWARNPFKFPRKQASSLSEQSGTTIDDSDNDGVGDDLNSWSYDGARSRKWHGGDSEYGAQWSVGACVGCLLTVTTSPGTSAEENGQAGSITMLDLSFYLDGSPLGKAFEILVPAAEMEDGATFYPALSLDEQEMVRVNFGQRPFKFIPRDSEQLSQSFTPVAELKLK